VKKKIIFGFHNAYVIKQNLDNLEKLSDFFSIILITTNHSLTTKDLISFNDLKKKNIIQDLIIFSRYDISGKLSLMSIIKNYLYLKKKIKELSNTNFDYCILGSNFFVWERIITEIIIKKTCKLIMLQQDFLSLPIPILEDLKNEKFSKDSILKVHKMRESKKNKTKKKLGSRLKNIYDYYLDKFDRNYLVNFFFNKKFLYRELDLNTSFECLNPRTNIIFTYFDFLKKIWETLYPEVTVTKLRYEDRCKCSSIQKKNKLIFLGDDGNLDNNNFHKYLNLLERDIKLILENDNKIEILEYRPHPSSEIYYSNKISDFINLKFNNKLKINIVDNSISLQDIACDYKYAVGASGTAHSILNQTCRYIKVIAFCSLSQFFYNDNPEKNKYKLFGTGIDYIDVDGSFENRIFIGQHKDELINKNNTFVESMKLLNKS